MRFLVDAQLPPSLARWIASHGHQAEHVAFVLTPSEQDEAIVVYAIANGAVIVTKDSDFLSLAPPLLIVTTGNVPTRPCWRCFRNGSRVLWSGSPPDNQSSKLAERIPLARIQHLSSLQAADNDHVRRSPAMPGAQAGH